MVYRVNMITYLDQVESIAQEGCTIVIKFDGERDKKNFYTVVLSGGQLEDDYFRKDGADLPLLLREMINFYKNY